MASARSVISARSSFALSPRPTATTVRAQGEGRPGADHRPADAIGGELACSRPLAEGVHWIAKDRNIGISGQQIAPGLYVAIGISGQLQHMVGVRDADVIVAVNSDKDALIFKQCDYGIVGDLYT